MNNSKFHGYIYVSFYLYYSNYYEKLGKYFYKYYKTKLVISLISIICIGSSKILITEYKSSTFI